MRIEVGHGVRVGHHKPGCRSDDGDGRYPVPSLCQLRGERPDSLLVVKKILGQRPPRNLAIGGWIAAVVGVKRNFRWTVRQFASLRRNLANWAPQDCTKGENEE